MQCCALRQQSWLQSAAASDWLEYVSVYRWGMHGSVYGWGMCNRFTMNQAVTWFDTVTVKMSQMICDRHR
jgi:hypothetical protein